MRSQVVITVLIGCAAILVACGSRDEESGKDESGGRSVRGAGQAESSARATRCPEGPAYSDRWSDQFSGGPSDGPVTLAVGRSPNDVGVPASHSPDGSVLFAKVLIAIAAAPSTPVTLDGAEVSTGALVRFTHFAGAGSEMEAGSNDGEVPNRGQGPSGVADLPGYVLVDEPGCFRITVRVGERATGPFFLRLTPPFDPTEAGK